MVDCCKNGNLGVSGLIQTFFNSIQFNFLSFGTLLVLVFVAFLAVFLLTLENKSKSTFHLGIAFSWLSFFLVGYLISVIFYIPQAAYHRYFTTFFVLPTTVHIAQWAFHYPKTTHPRAAKVSLILGWVIAIIAELFFILKTANVEKKFHFTGHYWDFDAEPVSKAIGIVIMLFSVVNLLGTPLWKTIITKGPEKWALFQMFLAFAIAAIVPNVTNVMSRDGAMERETYLLSLVLLFVLGFFYMIITFINTTKDKSTFMIKIVGITLVTFLLMMQGLSYFTLKDREGEYDALRLEYMNRYLDGGERNRDIQYVLSLSKIEQELERKSYSDSMNLELSSIREDFLNTIVYEEIQLLEEEGFRESLKGLLAKTHSAFDGYKTAILEEMEKFSGLSDGDLKQHLIEKVFPKLNRNAFVHSNKLSVMVESNYCKEATSYLEKAKDKHFKNAIFKHLQDCKWDGREVSIAELRREISLYFRYFKPADTRHYRKSLEKSGNQKHYISYMKYNAAERKIYEAGFSYTVYRQYMHPAAKVQIIILLVVLFVILFLYPLFFRGSLVNPLTNLLKGVTKVNKGDLSVEVPVHVQDEIGFLSGSFNSMVTSIREARRELQDYAENLEDKVRERTREVQEKMEEVHALKVQQDGDYYLTSLLTKPLFYNANKSSSIKTDFYIKQKKDFEFRNKKADLGGDICVTGNLKFGTPDHFRRFTMAMNGDAMGKSMQGAGGSLVMGVVMNSIMARSAGNKRVIDVTPEKWLTDIYNEIHGVFKTFNGTMVISCVVALIDEETGEMWYFNAEHPFSVLYRDGKASFIEDKLNLRKLGLDSEIEFKVFRFNLMEGDVVILGSDGRDDIDLTPDSPTRTFNDDENKFLEYVEKYDGDIHRIKDALIATRGLSDDLSFLRIGFLEQESGSTGIESSDTNDSEINQNQESRIGEGEIAEGYYQEAKKFLKDGETDKALEVLRDGYQKDQGNTRLNKLLGMLSFKGKDYSTAIDVLSRYLEHDPDLADFWFYLSISEKKLGKYSESLGTAEKLYSIQPENIQNLVNLSDLNRLLGRRDLATEYSRKALELDPENKNAKKLLEILEAV